MHLGYIKLGWGSYIRIMVHEQLHKIIPLLKYHYYDIPPTAAFCLSGDLVSSLFSQLEKFCLKSGVSAPSRTQVTLVQFG